MVATFGSGWPHPASCALYVQTLHEFCQTKANAAGVERARWAKCCDLHGLGRGFSCVGLDKAASDGTRIAFGKSHPLPNASYLRPSLALNELLASREPFRASPCWVVICAEYWN